MNPESGVPERAIFKRILSPWGIAAIIMAIFFLGEAYLAWRDSAVETALASDPAFQSPPFELSFSKNIPYDPLSFVGRGAQAGLWKWSPNGLLLTDDGRKFFDESGERFVSRAPAGKRRVKRIKTNNPVGSGDRRIEFLYEWTEVATPAASLLSQPPKLTEEYPGEAVMTRAGAGWKVKSLRTQDFEEPMAHLQEAASGVLK
jgi:hypothetical protein